MSNIFKPCEKTLLDLSQKVVEKIHEGDYSITVGLKSDFAYGEFLRSYSYCLIVDYIKVKILGLTFKKKRKLMEAKLYCDESKIAITTGSEEIKAACQELANSFEIEFTE